jgi:hypothetical protein
MPSVYPIEYVTAKPLGDKCSTQRKALSGNVSDQLVAEIEPRGASTRIAGGEIAVVLLFGKKRKGYSSDLCYRQGVERFAELHLQQLKPPSVAITRSR